jgi:hypothetical protein
MIPFFFDGSRGNRRKDQNEEDVNNSMDVSMESKTKLPASAMAGKELLWFFGLYPLYSMDPNLSWIIIVI